MSSFSMVGLDRRLVKALNKLGIKTTTAIQEKALPLALEGKDILLHAPTGAGKTLCFVLPALHAILSNSVSSEVQAVIRVIILVPTRDLCTQVEKVIEGLSRYCWDVLSVCALSNEVQVDRSRLLERPNIVVSTPGRIVEVMESIKNDNVQVSELFQNVSLVSVDEADLVLNYGSEDDLKELLQVLPKLHQTILTSATLSPELDSLKQLVMQKPVTIRLSAQELEESSKTLSHYYVLMNKHKKNDEFLFVFSFLRLGVTSGKTIFFVNDIDRGFRLKLFLEAFSIRSVVLNSDLPINSRERILNQFNLGMFDILIATDACNVIEEKDNDQDGNSTLLEDDQDYRISRGIDFQDVVNVINFDFPGSLKNYVHRVGRTARAGKSGTCLSFIYNENSIFDKVKSYVNVDNEFKHLDIRTEEVNTFRYRVEDILRGVTRASVREARLKDVKSEILNSEKLKSYFEENPDEAKLLKHDKILRPREIQSHLKVLPAYLMKDTESLTPISTHPIKRRIRSAKFRRDRKRKRYNDPLKSFKSTKRRK